MSVKVQLLLHQYVFVDLAYLSIHHFNCCLLPLSGMQDYAVASPIKCVSLSCSTVFIIHKHLVECWIVLYSKFLSTVIVPYLQVPKILKLSNIPCSQPSSVLWSFCHQTSLTLSPAVCEMLRLAWSTPFLTVSLVSAAVHWLLNHVWRYQCLLLLCIPSIAPSRYSHNIISWCQMQCIAK